MKLAIVVTPNFNMAATAGFIDPFRAANYVDAAARFRWQMFSQAGGPCPASNGMSVETDALASADAQTCDIAVMSSSWTPEAFWSRSLQTALRRWARAGSVLVGLDTGAVILARAGLLSGRRASVHYEHIDAMREMFPDVETTEDLFVLDGTRVTCCGGSAAPELALHLLRRSHGEALANAAARYIFVHSLRPAGAQQNPPSAEPVGASVPEVVRRAIVTMEAHLEEPLPIPALCRRLEISQRQLERLFRQHVRQSPADYYRDIRLDRARGLVMQTDMALSEVAVAAGFAGQVQFSRAYRSRFGLTARDDRIGGRLPFGYRPWPMHGKAG